MREIKTVWYNIAGVFWTIQAVLSIVGIFSGEQTLISTIAVIGIAVCYILCAIGMFSGEISRFYIGIKALSIYISVVGGLSITGLLMLIFVSAMFGFGFFIIAMIIMLGLVIAQYWMLTKIAEKADDNISIEKEWYIPGVLYGVVQIVGYFLVGYLAKKLDGDYQLNAGGILAGNIISIIFGLAMLLTTGYAFYDGQKGMSKSGTGGYDSTYDDISMINPNVQNSGPYIYDPRTQVNNQYSDEQNTQTKSVYTNNKPSNTYYNGSGTQNPDTQDDNSEVSNKSDTGSSKFTLKKD
ncbi:MAG: hypothetical protein IJV15_10735 [Lachnospiraceae bacterium]|nr:hypothetical protein [Lachnospiraceae bacterium]